VHLSLPLLGEDVAFSQADDIHTVMQLFIAYLSQLPQPLIPHLLATLLVEGDLSNAEEESHRKRSGPIILASGNSPHYFLFRVLICTLPMANFVTAKVVFKLLHKLADTKNGIEVSDIAKLFQPILFPFAKRADGVQEKVTNTFISLVQHSTKLFAVLPILKSSRP